MPSLQRLITLLTVTTQPLRQTTYNFISSPSPGVYLGLSQDKLDYNVTINNPYMPNSESFISCYIEGRDMPQVILPPGTQADGASSISNTSVTVAERKRGKLYTTS